jgi:cell division protease FtsH
VRRIVEDAHKEVTALLTDKREQLDKLAEALLEHETLDEDDAYAAAGVEHESAGTARDLAAAAKVTTT